MVSTEGPKAKSWCYRKECDWTHEFLIPETGVNLPELQRKHDGDFD